MTTLKKVKLQIQQCTKFIFSYNQLPLSHLNFPYCGLSMGTGRSHNSYYMHSTLLTKTGITVSGSKTLLNSVWEKQTQEV